MATERQSPDALLQQDNLSGAITAIQDDPDSPDANWLTYITNNVDTVCRVSFPTPTGNPTVGADLQQFKIWVRKQPGTDTPTVRIELYENGVSKAVILADTSVTSSAGQLFSATWNANLLGTANGSLVECYIYGTAVGGAPATRCTVEIGAVEWNVTYDVGVTPKTVTDSLSLSEALPSGTPKAFMSVADSIGLADAIPSGTPKAFLSLADSLNLADAFPSGTPKVFLSLPDSLALAAALPSGTPKAYIPVLDNLGLAEILPSGTPKIYFTLADTLALVDGVSIYTGVVTKTVTDTLSLTDAAPTLKVSFIVSDSLALGEAIGILVQLSVTDNLVLAEIVSSKVIVLISDAISLADALVLTARLTLTNSLNLTEIISPKGIVAIADSLGLSDQVSFKGIVILSDGLSVAEVIGITNRLTLSDTLALAETISSIAKISISDSLALAEAISLAVKNFITISDTLELNDDISDSDTPVLIKLTPALYQQLLAKSGSKGFIL